MSKKQRGWSLVVGGIVTICAALFVTVWMGIGFTPAVKAMSLAVGVCVCVFIGMAMVANGLDRLEL